jgi:amino acid transporter
MATTFDKPMRKDPAIHRRSTQKGVWRDQLLSEEYVVKTMPQIAGTLDLTATFVLIIFFITNVASAVQGGAGTFVFWIVGGITFFIPCVIASAQLGHMFPHEGSLYNWTHRAFGGYWSFFVAFCAWFPCILLMITAADVVVGYLQGLNPNWLVPPWQQGLVLLLIIALSGVMAIQRLRTVLNIVKVTLGLAFLAVLLVGIAGVVWLLQGHHAVASFRTASDWGFAWNPQGYYTLALFGFITQAYLGIEVPLNIGGEMVGRHVVTRHLLWGTVLVFVGYFVATFGVLIVLGTTQSGNPFALVATVDAALGKGVGNIAAILIMLNFVVTPCVYNYAYARLLLVGGIDQRLPARIARLSKYRVPANAIIFQTIVAIVFTVVLYIVAPSFTNEANAATLNSDVYNVVISASTLVWAISTAFLFINLAKFYFNDRQAFRKQLIFPMPVLWTCIVLGTATCIVSIVGTLLYSLIPQQIDNNHWWIIVGGITFVCIVVAAIGSMLASSEADWQKLKG